MSAQFQFVGKMWLYSGEGAWCFITLPKVYAEQIRAANHGIPKKGFGSVKVRAEIGSTAWGTSIFPDKESNSYVLPVKKEIRDKNDLKVGSKVQVQLFIDDM